MPVAARQRISGVVLDCAIQRHRDLGPGLLERVYEVGLSWLLVQRGLAVQRQLVVPVVVCGQRVEAGFRVDLLVDDLVLVEIKAVNALLPLHRQQVVTYLRLSNRWLGLLVNFGGATVKAGFERIVNGEPGRVERP